MVHVYQVMVLVLMMVEVYQVATLVDDGTCVSSDVSRVDSKHISSDGSRVDGTSVASGGSC